jgi:hypothetical protein
MTRRIVTAREQHAMLSPWRQAARDVPGLTITNEGDVVRAHINGEPAGWIEISRTDDDAPFVGNIEVEPQHRRKGVGTAMWEAAGRPPHDLPEFQTDAGRAWAATTPAPTRKRQPWDGLDYHTAAYDGPWPLHTAGGVFNPHLDWDEPDVSAAVHAHLHPDEVVSYARHDNEWRNLDNMDKLMGHLSEHGMLEPIYIGAGPEHAVIEDGHHRALAAQALGWGKVPVHITNDPHLGDEYETPHGPGLRAYLNGDSR